MKKKIEWDVVGQVRSLITDLLAHSNYNELRGYLLAKAPIASVMSRIQNEASQMYEAHESTHAEEMRNNACEAQPEEDEREARTDTLTQAQEKAKTERYERELSTLNEKQNDLNRTLREQRSRVAHQKQELQRAESALNNAAVQLTALNTAAVKLRSMEAKRTKLLSASHAPHVHGHSSASSSHAAHTHKHASASQSHASMRSTHSHGHAPLPPQQPFVAVVETPELVRHNQEIAVAQQAVRQYQEQVATRKREFNTENYLLQAQEDDYARNEGLINNKRTWLNQTWPANEHYRLQRQLDRDARAQARAQRAPIEKLLSPNNLQTLNASLQSMRVQLKASIDQLVKTANTCCFDEYLSQLQSALNKNPCPLRIAADERVGLHQILDATSRSREVERQLQQTRQALSDQQNKLRLQMGLITANDAAIGTNVELSSQIQTAVVTRRRFLRYSFFSGVGSLAFAGGVEYGVVVYNLSPTFFMIPGGLALLAAAFLIVALVMHIKKHYAQAQKLQDYQRFNPTATLNDADPRIAHGQTLAEEWATINGQIKVLHNEIQQHEDALRDLERQAVGVFVPSAPPDDEDTPPPAYTATIS